MNLTSLLIKQHTSNMTSKEIEQLILNDLRGSSFTQEDVWALIIDRSGYKHFGSINPIVNKLWASGQLVKLNETRTTMFGNSAQVYAVV